MEAQNVLIRDEKDTDYKVISDVTKSAFKTMEIINHTEQFIIEALRSAKALTVSLVAEVGGLVVGHIAFSPVTIGDGGLVRDRSGFSTPRLSASGNWKGTYTRRLVTLEIPPGERLLLGRASTILPTIRI